MVAFIDGFDGAGPASAVAVVDFAEVEQGFLNGSATCDAAVFHDAPVAVLLADIYGSKASVGLALPLLLLIAADLMAYPAFLKHGSW